MILSIPDETPNCLSCFEQLVVEYCTPTLASIKCASMFNAAICNESCVNRCLEYGNRVLKSKGISFRALRFVGGHALILVYRSSFLACELSRPEVQRFLLGYGYKRFDVEGALEQLTVRFKDSGCFPHEIGVFLGYPLEDVQGFIENCGENCILSGLWKVYARASEKRLLFMEMSEMKNKMKQRYLAGSSLDKLAV